MVNHVERRGPRERNAPADHHVVVRAIYFGVPGTPSFVKPRGDHFREYAPEVWASEERDMHPLWIFLEQRLQELDSRVPWARRPVQVELEVDMK